MPKVEKALLVLDAVTERRYGGIINMDARGALIVTVLYLGFMLSVPTDHIDILLWYALYPIIASPIFSLTYTSVLLQSLIVLPLVVILGIFNPLVDKTAVAVANGFTITRGWLLFIGIILRGLLSMQALLVLIRSYGFVGVVRSLQRLGVPKFITTQLFLVFRYIRVLIEEGMVMKAARDSRSYGRRHLPIKLWGVLVGQLFLRSVDRAERVHNGMLARGFTGSIPVMPWGMSRWNPVSTFYLIGWSLVFIFLRLFNLSLLFV